MKNITEQRLVMSKEQLTDQKIGGNSMKMHGVRNDKGEICNKMTIF